jgi:twinkle protein
MVSLQERERTQEAMTVVGKERCPTPGCDGAGDNLIRYEDGHGHCMSCNYHENTLKESEETERVIDDSPAPSSRFVSPGEHVGAEAIPKRRLTRETCQKFGYWLDHATSTQVANFYDEKGRVVAQKTRGAGKKFSWRGDSKGCGLFGQHLWRGAGKRIVITEGELDAMSLCQAQGLRWPVVSVKNGTGTARKDIAAQLQWLDQYEIIVLMFDSDEAGKKAAADCADLFEPGKCAIATLPLKDANEMLVAGRADELISAMWDAKPYRPDGVFEAIDLLEEVLTQPTPGLSYPWDHMNTLTHGMRGSEITLWTAGTGVGKSAFIREVAHHLHITHGQNVGYIGLEESRKHTALAQLSLVMNRPLHIPEVRACVPDDAIRAEADRALRGLYIYDHFGSVELKRIAPAIRYLAKAMGCKWIMLDHLSIMVSGKAEEGDERKRIDQTMTQLRTMVQEMGIGLHLVSHLRKSDGTPFEEGGQISLNSLRGSGAIAQLSDMVIGLERNQQDPDYANVTRIRVLKNRFSGETGVTGYLRYDPGTGRLAVCEEPKDKNITDERGGDTGEL